MPRQLELLKRSGLEIQPEAGRSEPRLWIRRLVIWSEPGVILREVILRPGLNIIWAPDPVDRPGDTEAAAPGHGSGKTLFCRLLRYCLGEARFAPSEQREKIIATFPNGMVGAEIMIDGTQWAVVRPIGTTRKHFAIRDTAVGAVKIDADPTGMDPFLNAVTASILSDDVATLVPVNDRLSAWPVALAWLARDQECRFDKPLDWRSADSDSGSPARTLSAQEHLDAVRGFIGAIIPKESKLRAEIGELQTQRDQTARHATHQARQVDRLRARVLGELARASDDLPPGRMAVEPLRKAAIHRLAQLSQLDSAVDLSDVADLRSEANEARLRVEELNRRLAVEGARIKEIEGLVAWINGEFPVASTRVAEADQPVCEICEVPIDRALAEGCRLSHKLPDFDTAKRRMEQLEQDRSRETSRLEASRAERSRIIAQLEPAQRHYESTTESVEAEERMREARTDAWYKARRLIDDVNWLDEILIEQERTQAHFAELDRTVEEKREQVGSFRAAHATTFHHLSRLFDAILRELIGPDATARVALDGNGLRLSVELGGERSTAAIDSLKIIAFDLAAMCMSIEGNAHQPAFLIHDSPREADLGLSIFHRLFRLVRKMEEVGEQPLFQYVITTTTSPPSELTASPWLTDTLGGATMERLLQRDL